MKLNVKEIKILSVVIAVWGIFFVGSGIIMTNSKKTITKVNYRLDVSTNKLSEAQAKKNEIVLKEIEVEINNPISVNIEDYIEDYDKLSNKITSQLQLDTSLVNTSQAGTYTYTVTYKKKKYQGTVKVKEKELPDMTFTLKNIPLYVGEAIPTDKRLYITESISDEVYQNIVLDISQVNNSVQNDYPYYIIYKNTRYEGIISVRTKVISPITNDECPSEAPYDSTQKKCVCKGDKTYDSTTKTCK